MPEWSEADERRRAGNEPQIALDHPTFNRAELAVFTRRVVADCMTHRCTMIETSTVKLDACCQYGCDVDLTERDAILQRADAIRAVLSTQAQSLPWFDESAPECDPDTPSGIVVRTAVLNDGCIFLSHDRRGCAIHRASIEQGWDFRGVKPTICRLFPLTYGEGAIFVSDDYPDYSCAYEGDSPTLYRVAREAIGDLFGRELVVAMDAAEARVLSDLTAQGIALEALTLKPKHRLPLL
jgi:Fe-S-cluster containining protein